MDKKTFLSLFFAGLSAFFTLDFWLLWGGDYQISLDPRPYLPAAAALLPVGIFLNLLFLIAEKRIVFLTVVVISLLPLIFGRGFLPFGILASLISVFGLILSFRIFAASRDNFKKIEVKKFLQSRGIFLVFSLATSLMVTGSFAQKREAVSIRIPNEIFDYALSLTSNLLSNTTGESDSMMLDLAWQTFESEVPKLRAQLLEMGVSDEKAIQEQIEKARRNYISQVRETMKGRSQLTVSIGDQMKEIKQMTENQINTFISEYVVYLPYGVGLSFFLTVTFFSSVFVFLINTAFLIIFRLLKIFKVVTIGKRSEEVEFLEI